MGRLEEMLLRNGLIMQNTDGTTSYIDGSLLSNSLVIRNSSGWVTHRIERGTYGDLLVVNVSTGAIEQRLSGLAA